MEGDSDLVRLDGEEIGDVRVLGPRRQVRPRGPFALADVVVTGKALVGAERLSLDGDQRALLDVLAWDVPARRKAGFVQHDRPCSVRDTPHTVHDDQVA